MFFGKTNEENILCTNNFSMKKKLVRREQKEDNIGPYPENFENLGVTLSHSEPFRLPVLRQW